MKFMICGYGRHGKDTVCEILRDIFNFTFISSSEACCEEVLFPGLKDLYGYKTPQECYDDRHNHRVEWFELIKSYNEEGGDLSKLAKIIYKNNDIYCGIRRIEEFLDIKNKNLFDISIWVDASKRLLPEDVSSITVMKEDCDYILDNNGSLDDLNKEVHRLMNFINIG